jgi:hypothetical protein
MPKRIRRDHENTELRGAKVLRARKEHHCVWCFASVVPFADYLIAPNQVYARLSEVRTPVCSAHFDFTDIVETDK